MSQCIEHLSPHSNLIASQQGLRYTCGIPLQRGPPDWEPTPGGRLKCLESPTTRESRSPQLT